MDGKTHINVYSMGKTKLGRLLSNFAYTPFTIKNHHFTSVEGWWQWYCTGCKYDYIKELSGYRAKEEGRKLEKVQTVELPLLFKVYCSKIRSNKYILDLFTHYYQYGDKIIRTKWEWTGSLWNEVRDYYKGIASRERR